ncbi:MAG: hypothetical protein GKC04_01950 [Methanomicrobiales archaeon]|nr:hypothetical protein [Methanomicrobiales archaeon]
MLKKAGYLHLSRERAEDAHGIRHRIAEVCIQGHRYGIRAGELSAVIRGPGSGRVEFLCRAWTDRLSGTAGSVRRSGTGKALVIDITPAGRFSIPVAGVKAVLGGGGRYATVSRIEPAGMPMTPPQALPAA